MLSVCGATKRVEAARWCAGGVLAVPVLQDGIQGLDVHPELQAADSQQLTEADASGNHRSLAEALQS